MHDEGAQGPEVHRIIAVHGTGDNVASAENPKWWQAELDFSKRLSTLLGSDSCWVDHSPFMWSSLNSERERRGAGAALFDEMRELEQGRSVDAYHLIGHSHGGSVISEAILIALDEREPLTKLKSITTVGAPFIEHRPTLSPMSFLAWIGVRGGWTSQNGGRLSRRDKIALVGLAVVVLAMVAILGPLPAQPFSVQWERAMHADWRSALTLGFLPCVLLCYLLFRPRRRISRATQRRAEAFLTRWQILWSRTDEAITGLSAARTTQFNIFRGAKPFAGLERRWWSLILGFGLLNVILFSLQSWQLSASVVGICVVLLLASRLLDPLLRHTVFAWLDGEAGARVRQRSFGDDVGGERAVAVSHRPFFAEEEWQPLPSELTDEVHAFVDRAAVETVSKVRMALGTAYISGVSGDALAALPAQITWNELVHTSYFKIERFATLVAYGIAAISDMPKLQPLHSDRDYLKVFEWWFGCAPTGPRAVAMRNLS